MTRNSCLIASLFLPLLAAAAPVTFDSFEYTGRDAAFADALPAGQYRNPILAGFYPDPSICRAGDDYYLVNSTFAYFPGIPVFHSRDLAHWTQVGNVISRPGQVKFDGIGVTRGVFAPDISWHDGTFYLLNTLVDCGGNCLFTAKDPAGPWSDPVFLDFDGIDPSLFFDDDGRAWLLNNGAPEGPPLYPGHRAIWIQEFDLAARKLVGPRRLIVNGGADLSRKPVWIEGPHLLKKDGWYDFYCAEGGTSLQHSEVVLRSRTLAGPFAPWSGNPILTQRDLDGAAPLAVTCTGHAELVSGPDGRWWSVFLGCRPFAGEYWTTGRETFLLPVRWTDDGWPVILEHGRRVPYSVPAPATIGDSPVPLTGNFTWRDDFRSTSLAPGWLMLREPHETWWSLGAPAGRLVLQARAESLAGRGNPSFLARRVQHARFSAQIRMEPPAGAGVTGGLALFQNEDHYFALGLARQADGLALTLTCADGKPEAVVKRILVPTGGPVDLRVAEDDRRLSFAWRAGDWQALADADALPVTVQAAGGGLHFTGAVVGVFARSEP